MSTDNDPREPGSDERPRDFPDALARLVEDDTTREGADPASLVDQELPTEEDSDEVTDRSVIIGRDGRWVAGWALRFIVFIVAGYIALQLLGLVWVGLLPILLAILVCTALWPPVRLLRQKLKFPAALASITVILGFFAVISGIFAAMAPVVANQGRQLIDQAATGFEEIRTWLEGPPLDLDFDQFDEVIDDITQFIQDQSSNIASGVFTGLSAATSIAVTLVVMLVLTFFFLKDGERFLPWMRRYTGEKAGWHLTEVLTRTWNTVAGFIRTQAVVSFVDAFFIGIGLFLLGVPLAFVLAVITFFAGFIPIIGAFSAGALAVVIALVSNGFTNAVLVLVLIIAVQQLEGNILQPVLQSKAMNLHAAVVLLSVTVGGTLFGIIGAFLAVPVAAALAVWFRYHSEIVALRAGEITIDDIEISTARGNPTSMSGQEAFAAVRERMVEMGRFRSKNEKKTGVGGGSTRVRSSADPAATPEEGEER